MDVPAQVFEVILVYLRSMQSVWPLDATLCLAQTSLLFYKYLLEKLMKQFFHLLLLLTCAFFASFAKSADPAFKAAYAAALQSLHDDGEHVHIPALIRKLELLATPQEISDAAAEVIRARSEPEMWIFALDIKPPSKVDYSPVLQAIREKWNIIFAPPYPVVNMVADYVISNGSEEDIKRLLETADNLEASEPRVAKSIKWATKLDKADKEFLEQMSKKNKMSVEQPTEVALMPTEKASIQTTKPTTPSPVKPDTNLPAPHHWLVWLLVVIAATAGAAWRLLRKRK